MSLDAALEINPVPDLSDVIADDPAMLLPMAETYLCLARAFLPPATPGMLEALGQDLLEDLASLHAEIPISEATPARLDALRSSLEGIPDDQALLQEYSRLFLSPPAPAMLNLGLYLDGGIMGGSTRQMEAYYQRHGLERDASFRDLPDHLALNLQFLAWVLGAAAESSRNDGNRDLQYLQDARDLIARFTLPGVHTLMDKIQAAIKEHSLSTTYEELTGLLEDVLRRDVKFLSTLLPTHVFQPTAVADDPDPASPDNIDPDEHLACRICGTGFAAGDALAGMIARLQAEGLTTEHLAVCPDCRAETMGMRPLTPPTPKR